MVLAWHLVTGLYLYCKVKWMRSKEVDSVRHVELDARLLLGEIHSFEQQDKLCRIPTVRFT